ncbi:MULTISPECIES: hypothetical protein [Arthrobacter]|uniref:Uncharacterized protein n=1 Tax=Arthrobacter terricola TaxID=2547396 RepID=A0A4R5K6B1_9MICC|nr:MULTISPECIES: hypothetical protein [Arthrobacter]MBT8163599.1 hypothetical protein [Arthrobacter sp. GN70]TDF88540.1 hypothetical protein E1809_23775 [Arthrobacter terricola]
MRFHRLERTFEKWEHLRVLAVLNSTRELEGNGWQRIGDASFPWAYFSHALNEPREQGLPAPEILQPIRDAKTRTM